MKDYSYRRFLRYGITIAALCLAVIYFETILSWGATVLSVAYPLTLGCVIAYVLNILMIRLEKFYFPKSKKKIVVKTRRGVCMVLSLVLLVLIVFFVLYLVIPQVVDCFVIISKDVPEVLEKIWAFLIEHSDQIPALQEQLTSLDLDWGSLINKVTSGIMSGTKGILASATTIVGSFFGAVMNIIVGLIFSMYVLACKEEIAERMNRMMRAFMPDTAYKKSIYVLGVVHQSFSNFIVGQATEAVILGGLCALGMGILRLPYAGPIGALVGLTALIPVFGGYIGAALGAFMILTVDLRLAVIFLVYLIILQQLEGNLIYPRVVGSSIGLPGIWVLAAIMIGSGLGGVVGMLVGVPISASCYKLLRDATNKKELEANQKEEDILCAESREERQEEPVQEEDAQKEEPNKAESQKNVPKASNKSKSNKAKR